VVSVGEDGGRSAGFAIADPNGGYQLQVEPGAHRVFTSLEQRQIRVASGGARLDLRAWTPPAEPLRGRVVGPDGRPLAGARVESGSTRTSTDADGRYVLPCRGGFLVVMRDGYATAWSDGPDVRLGAGCDVTGHLVGLAPRDLAAAAVHASPTSPVQQPGEKPPGPLEIVGSVDAAGRYRLAGLAPGSWRIFVDAGERQLQAPLEVAPGARILAHDLIFPALSTAPVSGRVVSPDGAPVSDVRLSLAGLAQRTDVQTGERGGFAARVPPGRYTLSTERGELAASREIEVGASGLADVEIRLAPDGAVLTGRVHGLERGEAAGVALDAPSARAIATDADGRYRIPRVSAGRHRVFAHLGEYEGLTATGEVDVPPGAREATLDLAFPPRDRSLEVRVAGVADLLALDVDLVPLDPPAPRLSRSAIPGEDGRVRFDRLPAGRYLLIVRQADESARRLVEREVGLPATAELVLDLAAAKPRP